MAEHPCEKGLTKACFQAYPKWARQAFAYKLVHLLVPKPLSLRLPRGLNRALIGPGATFPPGLDPSAGWIIPPDYEYPAGWESGMGPPPGWLPPPGDKTTIPPGGPVAPINVAPWQPGPPFPAGGIIQAPSAAAELLATQNGATIQFDIYQNAMLAQLSACILTSLAAQITHIDLTVSRLNHPADGFCLQIWYADPDGQPVDMLDGGESIAVPGESFPDRDVGKGKVRFTFPDAPILDPEQLYTIVAFRDGDTNGQHTYQLYGSSNTLVYMWGWESDEQWHKYLKRHFAVDVYGYPL